MKKKILSLLTAFMTLNMFEPFLTVYAEGENGETDSTVEVTPYSEEHIHEYGNVSYEWSEDNSSLTGTAYCLDETCESVITEQATVNAQVTKEATCTETGVQVITGTFVNTVFETQVKQVELPTLSHHLNYVEETETTAPYWVCDICHQMFEDENAEYQIDAPIEKAAVMSISDDQPEEVEPEISLSTRTHVRYLGWQKPVSDGEIAGTTGRSLSMEAIEISVDSNIEGSVVYRTHVQNVGWQNSVSDGQTAGTTGRSLRMEAIEISLTGDLQKYFDIYYRVHVANVGWMDWAKNGQRAGTQGYSLGMEAIQIVVVKKGENAPANTSDVFRKKNAAGYELTSHQISADSVTLNVGETKSFDASAAYVYWNSVPSNISVSSSSGCIQIGSQSSNQTDGWTGTVYSGTSITGLSKGRSAVTVTYPDGYQKTVNVKVIDPNVPDILCSAHVQNIGWQGYVEDGQITGTTGRSLRLEALNIQVDSAIPGNVEYRTHVENIGWKEWVSAGQVSGTTGCSLAVEAVSIRLTGELANKFDIYYRVHSKNFGWLGWACNGADAGTQGYRYRAEAIQIVLVNKGGAAPGSTDNAFRFTYPKRSFPYYNQKDPRWASQKFGKWTLGSTGCGTCVYAMAFTNLTGRTVLPTDVASYLYSAGEYNNNRAETGYMGTTGKSHLVAAKHWGVHCDVLHSYDEMVDALQHNKIISICVGPGTFVNGNYSHELLVYGTDVNNVMVLDPLTQSLCHNYPAFEIYRQGSTAKVDWDAGGVVYAFY